MVIIIDRQA